MVLLLFYIATASEISYNHYIGKRKGLLPATEDIRL